MATIIAKVTEKCNSNCLYCDVIRKSNTGNTMSDAVLEALFIRINEYLGELPEEEIDLLWHGGEPLLPGPDFYRNILSIQDRYCQGTKKRIKHSIQTNLTCLTEEYIAILKELGITSIGTSYDPEPHMRGPGQNVDTILYNSKFINALKILEKYDVGWGVIYVVTRKSLKDPLGVFHFMTNFKLTGGINFNPVLIYDDERKYIAITPFEFVEFLGTIFPAWWEHRDRYPDIEPFKSLTDNIINGHTSLACVDSGSCTYHHINLSPVGDASQCGRSSDWKLLDYGNITTSRIRDILFHNERKQLELRTVNLFNSECAGCRFWGICHGGCPLDAWSKYRDFQHKSEWCYSKKGFIEKYFEPVTGVKYQPAAITSTTT